MSDKGGDLHSFVERALSDVKVCFKEIEGIAIASRDDADKRVIDRFWNELMIFVHDYDIRMKEEKYNATRKDLLRAAYHELRVSGLL